MNYPLSFTGLAALAMALPASAQTFTELIREGDPLPGGTGEIITRIDNVDINGSGDWLIELDTDASANDAVVLHNGAILWQEGTSLGFTAPAGQEASSFIDTLDINDAGDIMFITPLRDTGTTTTNGTLLVWNGVTIIERDVTPCNAAGLPAGTIYTAVSEAWQNNNGQLLVGASVGITGVSTPILLRIDLDAAGNITSETKLALRGETLPGPNHVTPIQGFSFSKGRQAINDNGESMWYVDDDHTVAPGDTLTDANIYMTDGANVNTLLYNEADPFPADLADVFDHFSTAEIDLNNSGDFVFSGFDRGPSSDDSWIFKSIGGVIEVLAHEGDPVPASVGGGWNTAGFGFGGVVPMSNNGDVIWFLDWDDPDTTIDTGLMFNNDLILQEGVSMLGGLVLEDVPNSDSEIAMSDSGTFAIIEVVLDEAAGDLDAVYVVELSGELGTSYCAVNPNSTGAASALTAMGSLAASDNDILLTAADLPTTSFGYFLTSLDQGFVANPGGSAGNLCLDGDIGRYVGAGEIQNSGAAGTFSLMLDLTQTPTPTGFVGVMAGETRNFQTWHRDDVGGVPTSNFTNGLAITFN
jgi:hypothetical protein